MLLTLALAVLPVAELGIFLGSRWFPRDLVAPVMFMAAGIVFAVLIGEDFVLGLAAAGLSTLFRIVGSMILGLGDFLRFREVPRRR